MADGVWFSAALLSLLMSMPERSSVFAVTGEDVVRLTLDGAGAHDPESLLSGVGAQCVAVDPGDPDRVYVGTFDDGL
jgi:hypothetical protein